MVLELTVRVSIAFWVNRGLNSLMGNQPEGLTSVAMQQGGIGLLLTTLIISVPPMAAMFFQGTLGSFSPYSVFAGGAAGSGRPAANGQIGGYPSSGYTPPEKHSGMNHGDAGNTGAFAGTRTTQSIQPVDDSIRTGKT
jgi:type IV secretion system protein VirB6